MQIFLVPRNCQALLAMPYIETLDVLTINCKTTDIKMQNKHTYFEIEDRWPCTNNKQKAGKPDKCSTNTAGIPHSNNGGKAMAIDKINSIINYFIAGPHQEADIRASAEIMQQ